MLLPATTRTKQMSVQNTVYAPYIYASAPALSKAETAPPEETNPFQDNPK